MSSGPTFTSDTKEKCLAIIRRPHIAIEDHSGDTCVVFETYITECSAASQWISPKDETFVSVWNAMNGNVENLDGKPCWVEAGAGFVVFQEMAKI